MPGQHAEPDGAGERRRRAAPTGARAPPGTSAGVPETPSSVVATARSRRSSRSANREVEALPDRPDPRLGEALRTRRRTSTARSSPRAPSARSRPRASRTARPRSRPCRWSRGRGAAGAAGPGRSRETQAVSGQPVARRARSVVARWTASTTIGTPAESASASTSSRRSLPAEVARLGVAVLRRPAGPRRRRCRRRGGSGSRPCRRRACRSRGAARRCPRRCGPRCASSGHVAEAVVLEQPAHVGEHRLAPVGRRPRRCG